LDVLCLLLLRLLREKYFYYDPNNYLIYHDFIRFNWRCMNILSIKCIFRKLCDLSQYVTVVTLFD